MKHVVYGNDEVHKAWAGERLGLTGDWPADTRTLGVEKDGDLLCVVLFNMFVEKSCTAHIVSDGGRTWASREVLTAFFAYPFVQCGLRRITLAARVDNIESQILALKLGFTFEGRLRKASEDGGDEILFGMLRSECRWLSLADRGVFRHG